jgi:SH3 domain-containing YSC84-like protein 1
VKKGSQAMKRNITRHTNTVTSLLLALVTPLLLFGNLGWAADEKDQSDIQKRIRNAADVLNEIMAVKDKAIPDKIMADAECVAVVPSMVKIAIGIGGNHGKGVATCKTSNGWSAPAPFTITGGSWGLQIGGQAIDLVMLVMNQKGMDALLSSKFKVGADASAAAGPVGRQSEASTDWKMKAEVLTYSRARGVFAGIDLSGSRIAQDKDETRLLFGKMVPFDEILSGKVTPPDGSEPFLSAVRKYASQAREQGSVIPPAPAQQ